MYKNISAALLIKGGGAAIRGAAIGPMNFGLSRYSELITWGGLCQLPQISFHNKSRHLIKKNKPEKVSMILCQIAELHVNSFMWHF